MTTALLDTNILIALEDTGRTLDPKHAELLRNARQTVTFYIHPLQVEDIEQDNDVRRRTLLLSRIKQFETLKNPPSYGETYFEQQGWKNSSRNDVVDNNLLACVLNPVVDCLITEDKGIIKKAKRSGVGQRVMTLEELHSLLAPPSEPLNLAYVFDEQCHSIDIHEPFFDSLREDYGGEEFDRWFEEKCARGQRQCWTVRQDGRLLALCVYKQENAEIIDDTGFSPKCKMLKLCTFKVSPDLYGSKVGERLFFRAFQHAKQHSMDFVYFTAREDKQVQLINLALDFGFERYGHESSFGDRVIGKYLSPPDEGSAAIDKAQFCKKYYPSFKDDGSVRKFLVPIMPKWHERLFPDISDFHASLFGNDPSMYSAESNTIRKAYLCKSAITQIQQGDILFFYRSHDRKAIDAYGVVDSIQRTDDVVLIEQIVKRRTVYSIEEISEMLGEASNGVLVICFDLIGYLGKPVKIGDLKQFGVSIPQSIISISDDAYEAIKELQNVI